MVADRRLNPTPQCPNCGSFNTTFERQRTTGHGLGCAGLCFLVLVVGALARDLFGNQAIMYLVIFSFVGWGAAIIDYRRAGTPYVQCCNASCSYKFRP